MAFNDYFQTYPNQNSELRTLVLECYEFGKTISREPTSAHSNGIDEHALLRQRSYVDHTKKQIEALAARPRPDMGAVHKIGLPINMAQPYATFTVDVAGEQVPINERAQLFAEKWAQLAVTLAKSQSASLAGSIEPFDSNRCLEQLDVMSKMLDEAEARPFLDLPETADAGAPLQVRSGGTTAR